MAKVQHINVAYSSITHGLYGILSIEVLSYCGASCGVYCP